MTIATSALHERPELLLGPNPFIEALPPFVPYDQWANKLRNYPLDGADWRSLRPGAREALLSFSATHFVPIRTIFDIASGLQDLLRRSLVLTNPLDPNERRRRNTVLLSGSLKEMRRVASLDAAGSIIKGMTGMGKSRIIARVLEIIAPDQVIRHGPSEECRWTKLDQLIWVYVNHASNGSRGGLLKLVLSAIDEALGTDYYVQHHKKGNIDSLLATVARTLSNHRVALLVIDEKQKQNFDDSPWGIEFILFYLTLMNLGISVVMVGSPLAFVNLEGFSQVQRRFSIGGIHELVPASSADTPWWKEDFIPRMRRRFSLLENDAVDAVVRDKVEFEHTGGVPGLYVALDAASQRAALRRSSALTSAELRLEDIYTGANSATFRNLKDIALAATGKESNSFSKNVYLDIPETQDKASTESAATPASGQAPQVPLVRDASTHDAVQRLLRSHKANLTRQHNSAVARLKSMANLSEDELTMLGFSDDLIQAALKTRDDQATPAPPPKGPKPNPPAAGKSP
jgi:hypothetical protein